MKIREALELLEAGPILRRYFIINFFDGAVTTLGVLISSYLAGLNSPLEVAIPVLGAGISMFSSGFLGSFFTELAEREREMTQMKNYLLEELDETYYAKALRIVSFIIGLVDGISPFLASVIGLLPMLIAHFLGRTFQKAFALSVIFVFLEIFVLGMKLGKISGKNPIIYGLKMLIVGFVTSILIILMGRVFGVTPMRFCFYYSSRTPEYVLEEID